MSVNATAHVVGIGPYDEENNYVEVRIVALRDASPPYMDMTNQLFVVPISNPNTSIRTQVKAWTGTNWGVPWGLLDTVQLYGAATLL